ncbi:MAG TPA: hypothetical protein VFJ82_26505 [Longimicrobium sp.]|nr:hypothetical protein [Longimicrobium sp.]
MHRFRPAAALLAALALAATHPARAGAQCAGCLPRTRGEGVSLAGNALLAGTTAAIGAGLHRRPVAPAFAAGAAGGVLTYAGKRIAVEDARGAGALGREVAALGTSVAANAAEGRGVASRLVLPAGPVRLYVNVRGPGPRLRARADAAALAGLAYAASRKGARFDAGESLSAGALVFRVRGVPVTGYDGRHVAGVVMLRDGEDPARVARAGAHERVHVIQYDQSFLLWAAPAEGRLTEGARWSRALHRWADLGLNEPALAAAGALLPYHAQPWEAESRVLAAVPLGRR